MAKRNRRHPGNNGRRGGNHPSGNNGVLRLLAALVKGQARMNLTLQTLQREMKSLREDFTRGHRMLLRAMMEQHRDIRALKADVAGLKTDVGDLKARMTRVERRLNHEPPGAAGPSTN